jgi:hypothetical protein
VFGIARFLHDRTSIVGDGRNNTVLAGGGGVGFILPLVRGKLDFRGSGLVGEGIGRYGSGQLNDATFSQSGAPLPLPEVIALIGLEAHPVKSIDLYGYAGTEEITHAEAFNEAGKPYGYGNPLYSDAGCNTEQPGTPAITCTGNTKNITQGTFGAWWRFLRGDYGTMQTGVQYSYTRKTAFDSIKGGTSSTDDNMVFFSFRYLPFQ